MAIRINHAQFPRDVQVIRELFSGYAASLGIDLTFQSFEEELDAIPGKYATTEGGALLIAFTSIVSNFHDGATSNDIESGVSAVAIGCVALRRSSDGWCEMKRLYVLPKARGLRLGDKLVEAIIDQAKALGYRGIRLDTLPDMLTARRLYQKHGFVETTPYYDTPVENTIFLECDFTREL